MIYIEGDVDKGFIFIIDGFYSLFKFSICYGLVLVKMLLVLLYVIKWNLYVIL